MTIFAPQRTIFLLVLTLFCLPLTLVAQQPAEAHAQNTSAEAPCVLLNNQNVLFGKATQSGNQVTIVQGNNNELKLARSQVLCWADSIRDLYRYRVDQRKFDSADVHLEEAKWCLRYGLYDLAAQELLQVYRTHPDNRAAKRVEQELRRRIAADRQPKTAVALASADDPMPEESSDVEPASYTANDDKMEFTPIMVHGFARDVQPILANRCGRCHNTTTESSWTLHLPPRGSRPSARMTRNNLTATAQYINFDSPLKSELRLRAMDGHAGDTGTFGLRDQIALKSMENWLEKSQPPGTALSRVKKSYAAEPAKPASTVPETLGDKTGTPADELDSLSVELEPSKSGHPQGRLPQVANPFDPEIFNRQFHR